MLTRALDLIAALPATPPLRREQIKLQVALLTPLMHVKGFAAPETKAAVELAGVLIEQAEALGEPPEDPLLLFSVLYGVWVANYAAFNGDLMHELAAQFLALAEKQGATAPLMIGHRLMGTALLKTGDIADALVHLDRAIALYDPAAHRPLATRFGQDVKVVILCWRALALWLLGYPEAARVDADETLKIAREIGQAATLMYALQATSLTHIQCGNWAEENERVDELVALADEKGSSFWKANGMMNRGSVLAPTGSASDAIEMLISGIARLSGNGSNTLDAFSFAELGPRPCGAWTVRGGLVLHRGSENSGGNNQGKVVRGRGASRCWRGRAQVAVAGRCEGGSVFRACTRGRTSAASQVLGTARRNEHGAALARSG